MASMLGHLVEHYQMLIGVEVTHSFHHLNADLSRASLPHPLPLWVLGCPRQANPSSLMDCWDSEFGELVVQKAVIPNYQQWPLAPLRNHHQETPTVGPK